MAGVKTKLEKIRASDEMAKKRWVVGASAVTMVIIIIIWLSYLSAIIKPVGNPNAENNQNGFWSVFKNGLAITGGTLKEQLRSLISKLMSERSIEIEK